MNVSSFSSTSIPQLPHALTNVITDLQVVDQTNLEGRYDFTLTFSENPTPSETSNVPDIYQAVQEQLGLKLQRTQAPVEVIVIDHAERPSEN